MIDTPRVSSVLALILLSWGVLEGCNTVLYALGIPSDIILLLKCAAIAIIGGIAGLLLSRWALEEWTAPAALPFAVVGPFIAAVHLANYLFGPFVSLAGELGIMIVGAFIVHGVLAALEQDDLGTPPPPR